jgi:hypothetical protein
MLRRLRRTARRALARLTRPVRRSRPRPAPAQSVTRALAEDASRPEPPPLDRRQREQVVESARDATLFIGLGAARSGTTWLASRLDEHPEILFSPIKEMHWFDIDRRREWFERMVIARRSAEVAARRRRGEAMGAREAAHLHRLSLRSDADYMHFFLSRLRPEHRAFGEISPSYALSGPKMIARMYALHTHVRFLFVMRNPADRLWSHLKMRDVRLRQREARVRGHSRPTGPAGDPPERMPSFDLPGMGKVRAAGDYRRTLTTAWGVAPRDHVFTCFYEDLTSPERCDEVVGALCELLGVAPSNMSARLVDRANPTDGIAPEGDLRRDLVQSQAEVYRWAAAELPALPPSWERDLDLLD